jgi:hypothetical protein
VTDVGRQSLCCSPPGTGHATGPISAFVAFGIELLLQVLIDVLMEGYTPGMQTLVAEQAIEFEQITLVSHHKYVKTTVIDIEGITDALH